LCWVSSIVTIVVVAAIQTSATVIACGRRLWRLGAAAFVVTVAFAVVVAIIGMMILLVVVA
jgi:hypothetical protein